MAYDTSHRAYSHFNRIVDRIRGAGINVSVRGASHLPDNMLTVELNSKRDTLIFTVPCLPRSTQARKAFTKAFGSLKLSIPSLSKNNGQFILNVHETARTFTLTQEKRSWFEPEEWETNEDARWDFTHDFPLRFRETDSEGREIELDWKVENIRLVKECKGSTPHLYSADVSVTAPEMETCFFIGKDESHLFISCLPKTITRLSDVGDVLMPPEVKRAVKKGVGVQRQGEFYFVPISPERFADTFTNILKSGNVETNGSLLKPEGFDWNGEREWGYSDHQASVIFLDESEGVPRQFVLGAVTNRRHKTVHLGGICEVFPNLEVPSPDGAVWD